MAFVTVEATVERVFFDGKGIGLTETYTTKDGETRTNRFTAWFDEAPGLTENVTGVFSGILSTKIDEYTTKDGEQKTVVAVSLNKAKVKVGAGHSMPVAPVSESIIPKGWAEVPAPTDAGAPF